MTPRDLLLPAILSLPAAGVIWAVAFRWQRLNFWLTMSLGVGTLALYATTLQGNVLLRESLHGTDLWLGVGGAAFLYAVFSVADRVGRALFPRPMEQLAEMYALKDLASPVIVGLLLIFILAPGEELYWRGLIQRVVQQNFEAWTGLIFGIVVYGTAHLLTGRIMLAAAATLGGTFWGLLYAWQGRLWPVVISHIVWDLLVFLVRPIGGKPSRP